MRTNRKAAGIVRCLRDEIGCGVLLPGTRLPRETLLAERFQVARNTVRHALAILAGEGVVIRRHGAGTFVAGQLRFAKNTVTLLVADSRYLTHYDTWWFERLDLIAGAVDECARNGYRLEILPIFADAAWKQMNTAELERLTPDSKVLIGGEWFAPVFDLLQSRRCRCRLICWGDFRDQANFHLHPKARGMALTALNIPGLFEQAVAALVSQSCRKIALFCPPPENPVNYSNHPLIRHYYREALRCYTRQSPLIIDNRAGTGDRVLKDLWDKEHFDGLIFCANSRCPDSNERVFEPQTLGLPDTVRLIMAYMVPYQAVRYPKVPAIVFDHRSLGASCVDLLLNSSDPAPDLLWPPVWKTPKNLTLHHH